MHIYRGDNQFSLDLEPQELVIDNFAGGGGASTGIEIAIGRPVDIAINHDPDAIAMHKVNHPLTKHYCESVWDVDPVEACGDKPVGLAWFSPDCKHFSKAKGGKPVSKKIRGLAWVAVKWAGKVAPRIIMLENVEEFKTWGPVVNGKPCGKRRGKTFRTFVKSLKRLGYHVEWQELIASDQGAGTIRKRLFLCARNDNQAITWPKPTHGDPSKPGFADSGLKPWVTAANSIDWSIPCYSIFGRTKPLAEKTMARIAKGIKKFVIDADDPFIAPSEAMVLPFITEHANGSSQRNMPANSPLRTICAEVKGGHFALVAAFLSKYNTKDTGAPLVNPVPTIVTKGKHALLTSSLIKLRGTCKDGQAINQPMPTITAGGNHIGEVRAFLVKYYSSGGQWQDVREPLHTIRTGECFGLVIIKGEPYQIVDIGMRMLEPRELYNAQGFPRDYIINIDHNGKKYSKAKQVARCGNSVPPDLARALVAANFQPQPAQIPKAA